MTSSGYNKSTRRGKAATFKKLHGFYPREEECGDCNLPRDAHDKGETNCIFEKTGRRAKRRYASLGSERADPRAESLGTLYAALLALGSFVGLSGAR